MEQTEAAMQFTETTASIAKADGTPGVVTIRKYCDMGLVPFIFDANGRRLLRADAAGIVRDVYRDRLLRRGRPGVRPEAA